MIFKTWTSFADCISEINSTQVDHAEDPDIVVPMYNLIEYIDNYPKISGSLYQRCRDEPASDNNGNIVNFTTYNATVSFKFKEKTSRANSQWRHKRY